MLADKSGLVLPPIERLEVGNQHIYVAQSLLRVERGVLLPIGPNTRESVHKDGGLRTAEGVFCCCEAISTHGDELLFFCDVDEELLFGCGEPLGQQVYVVEPD